MIYANISIENWLDTVFINYYSNFYIEKNKYIISFIHKNKQDSNIEYELEKIQTNQSNEILKHIQGFIKEKHPEYFF